MHGRPTSATFAIVNYSSTNDRSIIVGTLPPFILFGASIHVTVNAPAAPTPSVNIGSGKNLSVGTFLTPNGPQGLIVSGGPSVGARFRYRFRLATPVEAGKK